jgi:fumarylacetoacetate (FAA) hydrolase family protein
MTEPFTALDRSPSVLPTDADSATLIFRVMTEAGPAICTCREGIALNITSQVPTLAHLLLCDSPVEVADAAREAPLGSA